MTEQEWLASEDPQQMLAWLTTAPSVGMAPGSRGLVSTAGPPSPRKLRLFAAACCRDVWGLITAVQSRAAIETAERYADGQATAAELETAHQAAVSAQGESRDARVWRCYYAASLCANADAMLDAAEVAYNVAATPKGRVIEHSRQEQAGLLREIVGNPFRPLARLYFTVRAAADMSARALESGALWEDRRAAWLTADVLGLANDIYTNRRWDLMPVLADALGDARCDNEGITEHCRDASGVHVRGCWALDAVLGKE